jgi:hypothetical protein
VVEADRDGRGLQRTIAIGASRDRALLVAYASSDDERGAARRGGDVASEHVESSGGPGIPEVIVETDVGTSRVRPSPVGVFADLEVLCEPFRRVLLVPL